MSLTEQRKNLHSEVTTLSGEVSGRGTGGSAAAGLLRLILVASAGLCAWLCPYPCSE